MLDGTGVFSFKNYPFPYYSPLIALSHVCLKIALLSEGRQRWVRYSFKKKKLPYQHSYRNASFCIFTLCCSVVLTVANNCWCLWLVIWNLFQDQQKELWNRERDLILVPAVPVIHCDITVRFCNCDSSSVTHKIMKLSYTIFQIHSNSVILL